MNSILPVAAAVRMTTKKTVIPTWAETEVPMAAMEQAWVTVATEELKVAV